MKIVVREVPCLNSNPELTAHKWIDADGVVWTYKDGSKAPGLRWRYDDPFLGKDFPGFPGAINGPFCRILKGGRTI